MRKGLGVWENQAKRCQNQQWVRMMTAEKGLGLNVVWVLVLRRVVARNMSGALQVRQQT